MIEKIAKVAHEANRAYCETIGDQSQMVWGLAPDWQKESALKGVRFHFENQNADPAASHESWLKEKESTGWEFGPIKDSEKKEHPCMVPYSELPIEQRIKDYIFRGVVHAFIDAGVKI